MVGRGGVLSISSLISVYDPLHAHLSLFALIDFDKAPAPVIYRLLVST